MSYEIIRQGTITTIRESKKGFVVERNTCWQGENTDAKILVYYSQKLPKGLDMDADYNMYTSNALAIIETAFGHDYTIERRTLRKGYKVD